MWVTRLILFLLRRKLGLKKHEEFQFTNQRSTRDYYFFGDKCLVKYEYDEQKGMFELKKSSVSLTWLLDPECKIRKIF